MAPPPPGDGCDGTLEWWFSDEALGKVPMKPVKRAQPAKPSGRNVTLSQLPAACRQVVTQ
ncbi:MAG: penicillin-insensitive murein endopeptidase [Pseudomonadota bacterium]